MGKYSTKKLNIPKVQLNSENKLTDEEKQFIKDNNKKIKSNGNLYTSI